jgi:hypothetical protein
VGCLERKHAQFLFPSLLANPAHGTTHSHRSASRRAGGRATPTAQEDKEGSEGGGRKRHESQGKRARPPPRPTPPPPPPSPSCGIPVDSRPPSIPRASPRRAGPICSAAPPASSGALLAAFTPSPSLPRLLPRSVREWLGHRTSFGDAAVSVAARSGARGTATAAAARLPPAWPA